MCAIAGIQGENISSKLYQMMITLKHRGRDGSGVFVDGKFFYGNLDELKIPSGDLALGHNLLSIVGGEVLQPLGKDNMVLVCNGEIYNHRELKKDLTHEFRTESDIIVILGLIEKLYQESLLQALIKIRKYLDGDYAFAIYDGKDLAVLRDPLGVKPVYFGVDKERDLSAFASERKALWEIGIEEVKTLPPNCILYNWETIEVGNELEDHLKSKNHIKLKTKTIPPRRSDNKFKNYLKDQLKAFLIKSVEKRLEGLTEVGVMFSGGVDSTLLARISDDLGLETFLYAVGHPDAADLKFAQKTADHMQLPLRLAKLKIDDVRKFLPLVLNSIEEFNIMKLGVGMPGYLAAEMAHEDGIKVMISGQGADELFAGYHRYLKYYQRQGEETQKYLLEDIYNLYQVNLQRDDGVTMANHVELRVPYLDLDVINIAMNIPMKYKINHENDRQRKSILREIALELGVPKENVNRPKKAAQYGSGIDKMLRKVLKDEEYIKTLNPRYI